jgi:hypothetical protein
MSIASPYEKNRYFRFTASAYAMLIVSAPANAAVSATGVDFGTCKFVISPEIHLNS